MKKNLKRFSELDGYKIHKKDQDVNDWLVRGDDDHIIGVVNDLVVDIDLMKVAFLEVSLSDHYIKIQGKPHYILLPMENLDLDKISEEVLARGITERMIEVYPAYDGRIITPAYLFKLETHFDMVEKGIFKEHGLLETEDFRDYSRDNSETDNIYGPRSSQKRRTSYASIDNEPVFEYDLPELRVKYLELKKELKIAHAEREIAVIERDIALAQLKKNKLGRSDDRYHDNFKHK
jgi:hypothetical protein